MRPRHFIEFRSQPPTSFSLVDHFPFEFEPQARGLTTQEWTYPRTPITPSAFVSQFSCFPLMFASPFRWLGTQQSPASHSSSAALWNWGLCQAIP